MDLVDLIRQRMVKNVQIKNISDPELIQIGEHGAGGQPRMGGQDAVGAATAHRQRASEQVPHTLVQRFRVRPVVDGEKYVDFWYFDVPHNTAIVQSQQPGIVMLRRCQRLRRKRRTAGKRFIVPLGGGQHIPQPFILGLRHAFGVSGLDKASVALGEAVADKRIKHKPDGKQGADHGDERYSCFVSHRFFLCSKEKDNQPRRLQTAANTRLPCKRIELFPVLAKHLLRR